MPAPTLASVSRSAKLAGGLYLATVPFSIFGLLYVPSVLVVPGDASATSRNIMTSEGLFRTGVVSHLIGQILFVFVVLALYRLLKVVKESLASLMVVLVLAAVPMAVLNEVNQLAALRLVRAEDPAFTAAQLQVQAMLFLDIHQSGVLVTQVFWGLWLLPLGTLVFRSRFLPKLLGVLLIVAGLGYAGDAVTQLLFPGVPTVSPFTFVGELSFVLWLTTKGVNAERWQQLALAGTGHGAA